MTNVLPLASIRCLAYNQEQYIRQCLDGFVMQKTNFPFEIIVHDDASTDNTANIIREYAEKYPNIHAILETENQYSKHDGSLARIVNQAIQGKYVALCEGDDYWIDPLKLQKQVDFLENHQEYAMVYTSSKIYDQTKCKMGNDLIGFSFKDFNDLLARNCIPTLTTCIRTNITMEYTNDVKPEQHNWLMGDYPMWLWIAYHYKIKFFPEATTVYRHQAESASHSRDLQKQEKFALSVIDITTFYIKKFNIVPQKEYWETINSTYFHYYDLYTHKGNFKKAIHYAKIIKPSFTTRRMRKKIRLFPFRYIKFMIRNIFSSHS